ncbi:MAG TPA: hypothetical protein VJT85_07605 [Gemmatimonadaceae bacterium]|nr:hypothetical protein [Gemmatimonadaceae bacterium]
MAEIPIRRKEGRNIWPLLIGLIALAALLWFVFARDKTPDTAAARADSAAAVTPAPTTDSAAGAATTTPPPTTDSAARRP